MGALYLQRDHAAYDDPGVSQAGSALQRLLQLFLQSPSKEHDCLFPIDYLPANHIHHPSYLHGQWPDSASWLVLVRLQAFLPPFAWYSKIRSLGYFLDKLHWFSTANSGLLLHNLDQGK